MEYFTKKSMAAFVTTGMSRYREPMFTVLVDIGPVFSHVGEIKHVDCNFSGTIH